MPSHHTQFTVVYDGESLRGSSMDVRSLAPALLALGDLLEQSNRAINGEKASVSVNVKAFTAGCFGINFELVQSGMDYVRGLLSPGSSVRDTLEILALLGFNTLEVGKGLFWLMRKLRGRQPKNVVTLSSGNVAITYETENGDTESVEISQGVLDLYKDEKVRSALDKSLAPLRSGGIDSFGVEMQDGTRQVLATEEEVDWFALPQISSIPLESNETPQERILSIVTLSFKEDNKWRLSDGTAVFNVKISDSRFLQKVNEGASFAKGDMLRVSMVTRVSYTKEGLKTEYEVVCVLEHITIPRQLWLA